MSVEPLGRARRAIREGGDGEVYLSCLVAPEKHTGNTLLPKVGETVACGTSDGVEFRGEVVSLVLERHDLAINFRVLSGAENWEGRL